MALCSLKSHLLSESRAQHSTSLANGPESSPASTSPDFYLGPGDLNSGLCAHTASELPTQPSPQNSLLHEKQNDPVDQMKVLPKMFKFKDCWKGNDGGGGWSFCFLIAK